MRPYASSVAAAFAFSFVQCSGAPGSLPPSPSPPRPADVPPLVAEAGFLDVPPEPSGARYAAKMFYAFQPAENDAAHKPLFVFFNGGPGFATSVGLHAYGTGPYTLVDGAPEGAAPVRNPASFARFANLLYIDERTTGFSYALRGADGTAPDFGCAYSLLGDASDFARVVTFLEAHESLRRAKVTFVGESYGGARATSLLRIFLDYANEDLAIAGDLRAMITSHFDGIFAKSREPYSAAQVAAQFGSMVLIQPLVLGPLQFTAQMTLMPSDPYVGKRFEDPAYDDYDVTKPAGWSTALDVRALSALANAASGRQLLGVDLGSIPELLPAARRSAVRPPLTADASSAAEVNGSDEASGAIAERLGPLSKGDLYLASDSPSCASSHAALNDINLAYWFLYDLSVARVFLTHARYDAAIYAPAIPYVLQQAQIPTTIDIAPRPGVARPGWIRLEIPKQGSVPESKAEIRYPSYESSGHMVAVTQGVELADDVEAWLEEGSP